jgi:hypothetical protein
MLCECVGNVIIVVRLDWRNKLEWMWKEGVMGQFVILSHMYLERLRKTMQISGPGFEPRTCQQYNKSVANLSVHVCVYTKLGQKMKLACVLDVFYCLIF